MQGESRPHHGRNVLGPERLTALTAGQNGVHLFTAALMEVLDGSALPFVHPLVSPAAQGHKHGIKAEAFARESILVARRLLAVLHAREHALLYKLAQPLGQTVAGNTQIGLELIEATSPKKSVAKDQQRPALPDHRQRAGNGTDLQINVIPAHAFLPQKSEAETIRRPYVRSKMELALFLGAEPDDNE